MREIDAVEVDITIAVLSVLLAGVLLDALYLVLGAVRTVERYGYGTADLLVLQSKNDDEALTLLATNLRLQEIANLRRHNRNAASFSTLRNAFLVAISLLATTLIALLVETFADDLSKEGCGILTDQLTNSDASQRVRAPRE